MPKHFDYRLSLAIDACHVEIEHIEALPRTPRRFVRLLLWRCRLARLLRKIPHE
jgi:hypothetical protein